MISEIPVVLGTFDEGKRRIDQRGRSKQAEEQGEIALTRCYRLWRERKREPMLTLKWERKDRESRPHS